MQFSRFTNRAPHAVAITSYASVDIATKTLLVLHAKISLEI